MHFLEPLLNPKSVAVVGASPKTGSFGGAVIRNLLQHFQGVVYPVNPQYAGGSIEGKTCYASLNDLPQTPDCLGIAVAADLVGGILEDAAKAGIRNAIVFSSGFADLGNETGRTKQAQLIDKARALGIRLLGPNCTGFVNVHSGAVCNILPSIVDLPMVRGDVAVIGQSGALGYVVLQAMHRGVGFSKLISTGNSSDIDLADLVEYLIHDPQTQAIALLFESIPDGKRFADALHHAFVAGKPVVVYKIGTTASGQKAALSHSGMLAGDQAAYEAVFYRTGAIQVHAFEALLETAVFFARYGQQAPQARGVGVISGSGGSVVMAADKADAYGLQLPDLSPQTKQELAQRLPSFAAIANPADVTAESIRDQSMYQECVQIFAQDPQFSSVIVLMPSAHGLSAVSRAQALVDLARKMHKPVALVWMNEWYEGIGSKVYDSSDSLVVFRSLDRCMYAYRAWMDYHQRRSTLMAACAYKAVLATAIAKVQPEDGSQSFSEREAKKILMQLGLPVTQDICVGSAAEAVKAAQAIGYPVVVKIEAAQIPHKTDVGGVKLNLCNAQAVEQACQDIATACQALLPQGQRMIYSVQPMVKSGLEMFIGARIDPQFGPMVVYGFGGVWVEVLKDVAISPAPACHAEVLDKVKNLKLYPLLQGVRGAPASDVDAFVDMVVKASEAMAANAHWIREMDINPVILHAKGGIAVDALMAIH